MDDLVDLLWATALVTGGMYGVGMLMRKQARSRWIAVMKPLAQLLGSSLEIDSLWQPLGDIEISGRYRGRDVHARCHSLHLRRYRPDGRQLILDVELDSRVKPQPVLLVSHEVLAARTIRHGNLVRRVLPGGNGVYPYSTSPTRFGKLFFERELDDLIRIAEKVEAEAGVERLRHPAGGTAAQPPVSNVRHPDVS